MNCWANRPYGSTTDVGRFECADAQRTALRGQLWQKSPTCITSKSFFNRLVQSQPARATATNAACSGTRRSSPVSIRNRRNRLSTVLR